MAQDLRDGSDPSGDPYVFEASCKMVAAKKPFLRKLSNAKLHNFLPRPIISKNPGGVAWPMLSMNASHTIWRS